MDCSTSREAATGRRALNEAASAMGAATSRQERAAVLAGLREHVDHVGALMAAEPDEVEALLLLMAGAPGMERPVGALRSRLRELAKGIEHERRRADARLRVATEAEDMCAVLGDVVPPMVCPDGYSVSERGIWREEVTEHGAMETELVSSTPIVVSGVLSSIEGTVERVCVQWRAMHGGWRSAILPRSTVRDGRSVGVLGDQGADVGGDNAAAVVRWLGAQERANAGRIPTARLSDHIGWAVPGRVYLAGRRRISPRGIDSVSSDPTTWDDDTIEVAIPPGDGREQILDTLEPRGALAGWLQAVDPALDHPAVCLGLYASMAAALVALLPGAPNAIVDWSGSTSRGKTSTLRVAASVWGRPAKGDGLVGSWDATDAAIEGAAGLLVDLPLILDDTKDAQDQRRIERVLYAYSGGAGRARARPDGMRRTTMTRGVLLSTGEAPVTSFGDSAGARARTLCLRGDPFLGEGVGAVVEAMCGDLLDHYGHAGPAALAWLLGQDGRLSQLREVYYERAVVWGEWADGPVARRFAPLLALLEAAAWLLEEAIGLPAPRCDVWAVAGSAADFGALDADRPTAALLSVYDWAMQHPTDFWERHAVDRTAMGVEPPRVPGRGWAGQWKDSEKWDRLCFVPDALGRILKHQGHPHVEEITSAWAERGWLICDGKRRTAKAIVHTGRVRVVAIRREALVEAGAVDAT